LVAAANRDRASPSRHVIDSRLARYQPCNYIAALKLSAASVFQPLADASTNIPASASNTEILIVIHGMHCNSCTRAVDGQDGSAIGVHPVVVSLLDETAKIDTIRYEMLF